MAFLRYLALLALALWIGGLVALGAAAAPSVFAVLQAHDPIGGRELAGVLFGVIFTRFQQISWGLAGVILVSLSVRALLGPRPPRFAIRVWVVTAMLAMSLATVFAIVPRIDAIRASVKGPIAALPDTDQRKITFGQLHGASNGLMLVIVLSGVALMWIETRDKH
jgi:hypothetical protein